MPLNWTPLLVIAATAFFVNALSSSTCDFYGVRAEPRDECELLVTVLNVLFALAAAFVLVVEYKPNWLTVT